MHELQALNLNKDSYSRMVDDGDERRNAQQRYERAHNSGKRKMFLARLIGQCRAMLHIDALCPSQALHYAGVRPVALRFITGSENRSQEFDREFYPLANHIEARWVNMATAMLRGVTLPPVVLIQAGNTYYVRDGHHRISVARALGQQEIDAEILVLCGDEE